jgi:hypothetical protein
MIASPDFRLRRASAWRTRPSDEKRFFRVAELRSAAESRAPQPHAGRDRG